MPTKFRIKFIGGLFVPQYKNVLFWRSFETTHHMVDGAVPIGFGNRMAARKYFEDMGINDVKEV